MKNKTNNKRIKKDNIEKSCILVGALIGGTIGGSLSLVGKMTKQPFIDSLGDSIIDSTILTGSISGNIISGTINTSCGLAKKNPHLKNVGQKKLKKGGMKILKNFTGNVKNLAGNGCEILSGVKDKDLNKIKKGTGNLAKMAIIGGLTVGAIKIDNEEVEIKNKDNKNKQ